MTADELEQINLVARTSGNDVVLDALLLRLHTETACRRAGALGLRVMDLDRGLVRLTEKAAPCAGNPSPSTSPPAWPNTPKPEVPRFHRRTAPLPPRRPAHLSPLRPPLAPDRAKRIPWVAAQGVSTHWLRHTTLTPDETARNTGEHSTIAFTNTVALRPGGEVVVLATGSVIAGRFEGDRYDGTFTLFHLDPLACFGPPGVKAAEGPTTLLLTSL